MKPHILQTLEDLRAEAARLSDLITTLESYGHATAPPALPAAPVVYTADSAPRVGRLANDPPARKARVRMAEASAPATNGKPARKPRAGSEEGPTEAVRAAMRALPAPFTLGQIRAWLKEHRADVLARAGKSTIGASLAAMLRRGEILEAGEVEGHNGYRLAASTAVAYEDRKKALGLA